MRDAIPAILAIVLGVMILQLGNGLIGVLVPLRMGMEGLSPSMVGVVATFYSLGFLAGCFVVPQLVRRIGHIRAFAVFAAVVSAGTLGLTLAVDWMLWSGIRFLLGICMAGLFSVAESWIVAQAPQAIKGRVLSFYMVCNKLTLVGGQMLVSVADPISIGFFLLISACASLSLVPVALTRAATPAIPSVSMLSLRELYAIAPAALVGCFSSGLTNAAVIGLLPIYGLQVGFGVGAIAGLVSVMQLGSLLAQWPLGWMSDRIDRRQVIVAGLGVVVVTSAVIALFGGQLPSWSIYIIFALWGATGLSVYAICIAHASDFAEPSKMVPLTSSLLLTWALGSAVGPIVASYAMEVMGPGGLFVYAGVIATLTGGFVTYRMTRRAPVPVDQREKFVNMPATSPQVSKMNPRAQQDTPAPDDMSVK
ncbi:MFS transporter [Oceanibaculum pacificum]|uniref:Major facilitator superfamily (MFS) profile domain-containing protein n=1 Tax=Oceanibaculum pacificum TaxID=580166 RepID=A0A154W483_9PROT|nr:MFS transporter [Oceanibaculum pacificum]KZD08346.1 hypothetical protein AUP43_01720 [Oceanibaculum pacificum]